MNPVHVTLAWVTARRDVGRQPRRALQPRSGISHLRLSAKPPEALQPRSGTSTRCCAFRRNELVPVAKGLGSPEGRTIAAKHGIKELWFAPLDPHAHRACHRGAKLQPRVSAKARGRRAARTAKTPLPARRPPRAAQKKPRLSTIASQKINQYPFVRPLNLWQENKCAKTNKN